MRNIITYLNSRLFKISWNFTQAHGHHALSRPDLLGWERAALQGVEVSALAVSSGDTCLSIITVRD